MYWPSSKYRNKKTEIDNILFDSRKESVRYSELKLLQRTKQISNLILQPKFILLPSFIDFSGKKHREILYIADFQYKEKGKTIVEDVKASLTFQTEVYKLKKKLFLYGYPKYIFKESY